MSPATGRILPHFGRRAIALGQYGEIGPPILKLANRGRVADAVYCSDRGTAPRRAKQGTFLTAGRCCALFAAEEEPHEECSAVYSYSNRVLVSWFSLCRAVK